MDADWTTSPSARRVLQHADDARPAWLWSGDGLQLVWHNDAAGLFMAKLKKHGLKRAPVATPIKGQVARTIRMGSSGRSSLARIQFLVGEKPASATCAATPLHWQDGQPALLLVGVDPIDADILAASRQVEATAEDADTPDLAAFAADASGDHVEVEDLPQGEALPLADEETELAAWDDAEPVAAPPYLVEAPSEDVPPAEEIQPEPGPAPDADGVAEDNEATEDPAPVPDTRLSQLLDRLATDDALFTPLTEADDTLQPGNEVAAPPAEATERGTLTPEVGASDAAVETGAHRREIEQVLEELAPRPTPGSEVVERTSRYNFDELSRILNDRVGENGRVAAATDAPQRSGALINLGGETLVLNRLPLGILVFRDQQVLFANRAITEMIGYESVDSLRTAGLGAVFPAAGPDGQEAGPVNHLVQRDGTLVPVTARLQSISWQGRPALMLSASTTEVRTGHEAAVRAFAQALADQRSDGFFETTRAGVISAINVKAASLLSADKTPLEGKPLSALVAASDGAALRDFLERPARFADTARPSLTLRSLAGNADISLFAQGQAGVISGYFGIVQLRESLPPRLSGPAEADPALLARISRGVRRPLNTIIGFAELIRTEAFGAIRNERYETYANDIAAAGQDIAALVDELDDYARLRDGRYLPQRSTIDLTALLESCVLRIRQQANGARVIVRNAISENLPKVTGDRASLGQAVLNLLASAIDQTPTGGAVVISAQREDDGGIAIHVRDSSNHAVDMAERFVVFRDGVGRDGQMMTPVRSSVGLALTRSLLAVNTVSLSVDPAGETGMLFSLRIPADLVDRPNVARDDA